MAARPYSIDALCRWGVIGVVAAVSGVGLLRMQFHIDLQLLATALALVTGVYALGLVLDQLEHQTGSFVFGATADFFCTTGQLMAFLFFSAGWQYLAAGSHFPLRDHAFALVDAMLGFDWHAYHAWMANSEVLSRLFDAAYVSVYAQIAVLVTLHCMRPGSDDNAEFLWCFMVGLLVVLLVSVPFPALGYPGGIGQHHIDVLLAARDGTVRELDGIVTFPSFHTVLGVLLVYYARHLRPMLLVSVPLNVLLVLATPPMGGHYLVDVLAGGVVAVCSILLVRKMRAAARLSPQAARATR